MEKNFYTDEFEDFLKEKADRYKMYPTERVWKKIYRQLHTYRRWTMYGVSAILMGASFFGGKLILNGADSWISQSKNPHATNLSKNTLLAHPAEPNELIIAANNINLGPKHLADNTLQQDIDQTRKSNRNSLTVAWLNPGLMNAGNSSADQIADQISSSNSTPADITVDNSGDLSLSNEYDSDIHSDVSLSINENTKNVISLRNNKINLFPPFNVGRTNIDYRSLNKITNGINPEELFDALKKDPVQEAAAKASNTVAMMTPSDPLREEITEKNLPVLNRRKVNVQFYIGPTISYRRLTDRSNKINLNNRPLNSLVDPHLDVDSYVEHKPSIGFEAGANALVRLNQTFTFKTGLQFNLSRYQIKGFNYYDEPSLIELNSSTGGQADEVIVSLSRIRNFSGYSERIIHNQYMQVSMPIGLEMRVAGNSKLNFNIAGAVEPTYVLNHDSYLLSTDYKNYSREPSLARRWNVNSGVQAYVSYEKNGLQWQIGPQFRYQLLSSFDSRYPIKEYLVDYGIKIGVSKILK
ncbi:MAG TPA: hypothetical protein VIK74_05030 [Parasegetibacter sp.]